MWPINAQKCIEQLKVFNFNIEKEESIKPSLPQSWVYLTILDEFESEIDIWHDKMKKQMNWSDLVQPKEYQLFFKADRSLVSESNLITL